MKRFFIFFGVLAALFRVSSANAQEPHHAEVTIVHPGVGALKSDLEKLLSYTSSQEQEQLQNVVDFVDLFAFGLDPAGAIRVDVLTGLTPSPLVITAPYKNDPQLAEPGDPDDSQLMENLDANFVTNKVAENLFELLPPDQGWLRKFPGAAGKGGAATLILTTESDHDLLKQFIMKTANPLADAALPESETGVSVAVRNKAHSADDQQKRRDSFAEVRANRLDAIQQRPSESAAAYDLRKGLVATQLNELERLLAESLHLQAAVRLNAGDNNARVTFSGQAIPETSLAKSIQSFNKSKDRFASVSSPENAVLSGRLNHPLDELRQKNVGDVIELLRKDVADRLMRATDMNGTQKKAAQDLFDGIAQIISDGVATGNINGFMESQLDDAGKFVTIGALSAKDGQRLNDLLKLVEAIGKDSKAELDAATVGEVRIHRLKLAKGLIEVVDQVFGEGQEFLIGASADVVWFGTGTGAAELLKSTIAELKEPADSEFSIRVDAHMLPWVRHWQKIAQAKAEPTAVEDKQPWRDHLRRLVQAVESYQQNDEIHFEVKAAEDAVRGEILLNAGTLTLAGKLISTFSKENFQ